MEYPEIQKTSKNYSWGGVEMSLHRDPLCTVKATQSDQPRQDHEAQIKGVGLYFEHIPPPRLNKPR